MNEKILVVDDEAGIRSLLCMGLKRMGFSYAEADNAAEALDKLICDEFSLVLLDISMPGMSGRELLPLIKKKCPDTAVIMATALTDASLAIECMKEGAYDYITKPFDFSSMAGSINRALEKRRLELENREYKEHLEEKVSQQAAKIRKAFFNAITSLVYALEARDKYTSGHSRRVTESAVAVASRMGICGVLAENIRLASLVHDIGKIGINENVLNKPGRLTSEEYQHIKRHPEIGSHILEPIVDSNEILAIVKHHHERYDGQGYPDGIAGHEIPIGARIIAVADTFDAMTSERPYRTALPVAHALQELRDGKDSQFEPSVVEAFLKVWHDARITRESLNSGN